MKRIVNILTILSIVCAISFWGVPKSEAQLFNKISKGLEKVNKGLEKVNKGLEKVEKATKGKDKKNNGDQKSNQPISLEAGASKESIKDQPKEIYDIEQDVRGEDLVAGMMEVDLTGVPVPHITDKTLFLHKAPSKYLNEMIPVSEGIFATREYNSDYGYGSYYGFWTLDGKCLTDNRYEQPNEDEILFDNGAVVLKDLPVGKKNPPFIILYADGTARRLPETVNKVSQFHDGIAVVSEDTKTYSIGYCIDTKGNKVWPHLSMNNDEVLKVGPLRDGLRLVKIRNRGNSQNRYKTETKIGYINKDGNWVIKPSFGIAEDFQNGYCIVNDYNTHNYRVIDTKGNTVLDLGENPIFAGGFSDGFFRGQKVDGSYTYYDLKGTPQASYIEASDFHNGYAFVADYEKYNDNPHIKVIDTDFKIVKSFGPLFWKYILPVSSDILDRKVGKSNLFTISRKYVVTPDGNVVMHLPQATNGSGDMWASGIGDFFPGDYAPCFITKADKEGNLHTFGGYINTKGEFEVVLCDDEFALRLLPGEVKNGVYEVSLPKVNTTPIGPKFIN